MRLSPGVALGNGEILELRTGGENVTAHRQVKTHREKPSSLQASRTHPAPAPGTVIPPSLRVCRGAGGRWMGWSERSSNILELDKNTSTIMSVWSQSHYSEGQLYTDCNLRNSKPPLLILLGRDAHSTERLLSQPLSALCIRIARIDKSGSAKQTARLTFTAHLWF